MNTQHHAIRTIASLMLTAGLFASPALADEWDAPAAYYNNATGTGETLKMNLRSIISSGVRSSSYDAARQALAVTDQNPANTGQVLLVYNRASVSGAWDNGNTWNREHLWPQSRLNGAPIGELFNLRAANPSINSSRGNSPFGTTSTAAGASYGAVGSFYYPGDPDRGDNARSLFFMSTRYAQLKLVNGSSLGTGEMGDLASLLKWHYEDVPDTFERRRNHIIYSNYQNNRNPYVDRPELVWSVFGDGANDSKLYVGATNPSTGTSATTVDLGRVMRNGAAPAAKAVTLQKAGNDPTYFEVTTAGGATSTIAGRNNAFTYSTQSRSMQVGLGAGTSTTGLKTGTVTVNNLDITTQGAGTGSADGDDTITAQYAVLDKRQVQATTASFGRVLVGANVTASSSLTTTGTDNERTRVNVGATSSTDASGARIASGAGTLFDAATDTGTRSLAAQFSTAGAKSGSLALGVTTAENSGTGIGEGAYANTTVGYTATVLSHAKPSFSTSVAQNTLVLNFGSVQQGQADPVLGFSLANMVGMAGYTAALDLDSIQVAGGVTPFSSNLAAFSGASGLTAGQALNFNAILDTANLGSFSTTYQLVFSDENLPGELTNQTLSLQLTGNVVVPEPALIGAIGLATLLAGRRRRNA